MKKALVAAMLVALSSSSMFAQTSTPAPSPTVIPVPIPVPSPTLVPPAPQPAPVFRLINAPNIENNTRAVLKCEPHEIIMSAVCNNHLAPVPNSKAGPGVAATYLNQTTAECRGASMNDAAVAICADYSKAQPSKP